MLSRTPMDRVLAKPTERPSTGLRDAGAKMGGIILAGFIPDDYRMSSFDILLSCFFRCFYIYFRYLSEISNKEKVTKCLEDIRKAFIFAPAFKICGNSSVGRAQPCQGWGREFESRFPLSFFKRMLGWWNR